MRVIYFLFAAAVIVVENINTISAAKNADRGNSIMAGSVITNNGHASRFLRTTKTFEADMKSDDEMRADVLGFVKTASLPTLDNLAVELSKVPGAVKFMKDHVTEQLKLIAAMKITPESLAKKLNIASKRKTMSETDLKLDPDYLLWEHYTKFWDQRTAKI